jgi:hypothetical protein
MSDIVKTKDPCPLCLMQNKAVNELQTRPGQFYTYCSAGHKFQDTEELNMLRANARKQYPNIYKSMEPPVPEKPDAALRASQDIIIDAETKAAIEQLTGLTLTGGADLKGMIFAYVQDNQHKDDELKSLRAKAAQSGTRPSGGGLRPRLADDEVILKVPEWCIQIISDYADNEHKSPDEWLQDEFTSHIESYFSPMMAGPGQRKA